MSFELVHQVGYFFGSGVVIVDAMPPRATGEGMRLSCLSGISATP